MNVGYSINYVNFALDKNLAFLIQQVTGDSTREILSYFYSLATFTAEQAVKESKARHISKKVILMYKDTSIPYKLEIYSGYQWRKNKVVDFQVNLRFPQESAHVDCKNLMNEIAELGLGLISEETHPLPKFEKPTFQTPRFLKQLRLEYEKRFKDDGA